MNELRWILLVAGLLLIAGIYAWGVRARRRAAAPEHERTVRVEPARTVAVVPEAAGLEPEVPPDEMPVEAVAPFGTAQHDAASLPPRREPRLEPRFDEAVDDDRPRTRAEPRIESAGDARLEPRLEHDPRPATEPRRALPAEHGRPPPPPRKPAAQKIVAVRIVAPAGGSIPGERLLEALQGDGFAFGRYQIFHRLDEAGRPVVSLASLKEPGTFDPATMPGAQFRGVALFAVMPGPLPALQSFDELIVTARALAAPLGGQLQDERGGPLTLQRLGQLRDEVAEFDRSRGAEPDA
jgi:cell division protein ZipA